MVVVVIAFPKRHERDPPTVSAAVFSAVWLRSPNVTNGVDAEGRGEDEEDTSHPGEQKAAQSAHPPSVEVPHHKREPQTGEDDQSVIPVLPHNDRVFAQFGFVDLIPVRRCLDDRSAIAVPDIFSRVTVDLLMVAPCMVLD